LESSTGKEFADPDRAFGRESRYVKSPDLIILIVLHDDVVDRDNHGVQVAESCTRIDSGRMQESDAFGGWSATVEV
jgi:hypothetical protein